MLALTSILILDMVLDLIHIHFFNFPNFNWVEKIMFLVQIIDHQLILIIKNRKKDILIIENGTADQLYDTTIISGAENSFNIKGKERNFV